MHKYRLYGLNIESSQSVSLLPEVEFESADLGVKWHPGGYTSDCSIRKFIPVNSEMLDLLDELSLSESEDESGVWTKADLRIEDSRTLTFLLDATGKWLDIYFDPLESQSDLESYFVGPIMSFVLRLRDNVCLHASTVGVNGNAIAFLGRSTAGKSTTAAGMARAGAKILADDVSALTKTNSGFLVEPGYSRVRLRPVAADFLTPNPLALQRVYSYRDSFYYAMQDTRNFESEALPLAAIYLLGEVSNEFADPFIKPLEPQERLIKLIENASGIYVIRGQRRADEFKVLAEIATAVPMRKLFYAHDISTLPKQCEIILEDFRKLITEN